MKFLKKFGLFKSRKSKTNEILEVLKSIDRRLESLESCVKTNHREHGAKKYLSTGHWNQ